MSARWDLAVWGVPVEQALDKLRDAQAANMPSHEPEVAEQFEAAIRALAAILPTVVPKPKPEDNKPWDGLVSIQLSGEARQRDAKTAGELTIRVQEG